MLEGYTTLLSVVHASNNETERAILWSQLRNIQSNEAEPWVCLGDFNEVINIEEKKAVGTINLHASGLKEFCLDMGLLDVNSIGVFDTWSNNQQGSNRVICKLDRVMANKSWSAMFQGAFVDYKELHISDHALALLQVRTAANHPKTPFKYLVMWQAHENYDSIIYDAWHIVSNSIPDVALSMKFREIKVALKILNADFFKDISTKITTTENAIHELAVQVNQDPFYLDKQQHLNELKLC